MLKSFGIDIQLRLRIFWDKFLFSVSLLILRLALAKKAGEETPC